MKEALWTAHRIQGNGSTKGRGAAVFRPTFEPEQALLRPHLSRLALGRGEVLIQPGRRVTWAHFPCAGTMVAMVIVTLDNRTANVGLIGWEGAVRGVVSRSHQPAFAHPTLRVQGDAFGVAIGLLEDGWARSNSFSDTFARYADSFLTQLLQFVACGASNSFERHMAGFLLKIQGRQDEADLPLTQRMLGDVRGVGRTTGRAERVRQGQPVSAPPVPRPRTGIALAWADRCFPMSR